MSAGRVFAGVFAATLVVGGLAVAATRLPTWFAEQQPVVEIGFDELSLDHRHVRLTGMAHYGSTFEQVVPPGLLTDGARYYVFAFFPEHDVDSRGIRLLVRTQRPPERLVSYEIMTVQGTLHPLRPSMVPPSSESMLMDRTGYWFEDGILVLQADRIESEDGVWEAPEG